jgi:hypothetical protein
MFDDVSAKSVAHFGHLWQSVYTKRDMKCDQGGGKTMDMEEFVQERDRVLLSGDIKEFAQYCRKHGVHIPPDKVLWAGFHKARTAATGLPRAARLESVKYLSDRGLGHFMDDVTAAELEELADAEVLRGATE